MKKILHLITGLRRGGTEFKLLALCRATLSEWQHHVITLGGKDGLYDQFVQSGIHVVPLNLVPSAAAIPRIWMARHLMRDIRPDLVFGWMYHGAFAAEIFGMQSQVPTVWSVHHSLHALETERLHTRALIRLLSYRSRHPKAIVYCSRSGRAQHEAVGFDSERGMLIQTGHNVKRFRFDPAIRAEVRTELGIADDAFVVGIVGRFHETKGFRYFFEAIKRAQECVSNLVVLGIGRGLNVQNVRNAGWWQGDDSCLRLLDEQNAIDRFYPAFDLAVSSSVGEALPSVIAEAMASERICIVTNVGDSAELLGDFGLVVPARDSNALASAIVQCSQMSPEVRQQLGANGRRRIESEFHEQGYIDTHTKLWEEVTSGL